MLCIACYLIFYIKMKPTNIQEMGKCQWDMFFEEKNMENGALVLYNRSKWSISHIVYYSQTALATLWIKRPSVICEHILVCPKPFTYADWHCIKRPPVICNLLSWSNWRLHLTVLTVNLILQAWNATVALKGRAKR